MDNLLHYDTRSDKVSETSRSVVIGLTKGVDKDLDGRISGWNFELVIGVAQGINVFSELTPPQSEVYDFDLVKFRKLASDWRDERNPYSSFAQDNMLLPSYQRIIGIGKPAIPLILSELKDELRRGDPDDWFLALWAITDENPVPEESRGKIREMAEAWINWGVQSGHVGAE